MKIKDVGYQGKIGTSFKLPLNENVFYKGTVIKDSIGDNYRVVEIPRLKRTFWQTVIFYLSFGTLFKIKLFYLIKRV